MSIPLKLATLFLIGLAAGALLGPVTSTPGQSDVPRSVGIAAERVPAGVGLASPRYPVEVLRVLDGDTFEARVHVWPGVDITTKIRLRGIDAPEFSRPRCDEERTKALAARDALAVILDQGDVGVTAVALDKYGGRVLADASTRLTPNVSAALLGAGHARQYAGRRREPWC